MRQRSRPAVPNNAAVVENLLKLGRRFFAMRRPVRISRRPCFTRPSSDWKKTICLPTTAASEKAVIASVGFTQCSGTDWR
jgi:hypothetical protein